MSEKRQVCNHFMIRKLILFGDLNSAVEYQYISEVLTENLQKFQLHTKVPTFV